MHGKIRDGMTVLDAIVAMSDGNPGALNVLMRMNEKPMGMFDVIRMDNLGIYGWKIWTFSKDCCKHDLAKISRTLDLLFYGDISDEQIHANLERSKNCGALPFIDDSIEIKGVSPYDESFNIRHPKWDEWAKAQSESFKRRTKEA